MNNQAIRTVLSALLLPLLISTAAIAGEETMFEQPSQPIQNAIHAVLKQQLFQPVKADYLTDTELKQRLANTKVQLKPLLAHQAETMAWLATTSYQAADEFNFYHDLREMLIEWIGEIEGDSGVLYQLALIDNEEWYSRDDVIRNLSNTHAKESLKKLLKPLLEYEDLPPQLYGAHDEYLTALVVNQVQEALPYLRDMQADLTELNEISLREDGVDYEFAQGIRRLVVTRAGLGDVEVLVSLIQQTFDHRYYVKQPANAALASLTQLVGEITILNQLGVDLVPITDLSGQYRKLSLQHEDGFVRAWSLNRYLDQVVAEQHEMPIINHLIKVLEDKQPDTRMVAVKRLIAIGKPAIPTLRDAVTQTETPLFAKYAALNVLANLGEDISLLQTQVESAHVPLPDFITPLLRQTIVEAWGNNNDRGTDIRWLTEYLLTVPQAIQQAQNETVEMSVSQKISASGVMTVTTTPVQSDKPESSQPAGRYQPELQIESLVKALKQDSIKIEEVIDYADEMSQGYSTYYLIKMPIDDTEVKVIHEDGINETATSSRRDRLNISKLGPFSYYERHEEIEYVSNDDSGAEEPAISGIYTTIDDDQNHSAKYKKAIENSGFISLSDKQLLFVIPGLNIRNFGDSKPLTVAELLFYWQD